MKLGHFAFALVQNTKTFALVHNFYIYTRTELET